MPGALRLGMPLVSGIEFRWLSLVTTHTPTVARCRSSAFSWDTEATQTSLDVASEKTTSGEGHMSGELDPSRFPDLGEVLSRTDRGIPAAYGIPGQPACQIRIFPDDRVLEVLVLGAGPAGDLQGLRNVKGCRRDLDEGQWYGVQVEWTHSALEPYLFACGIADRVQVLQETLATAVDVLLVGMRDLLRRQTALSRDKEVGLLGELIVLLNLIEQIGTEEALAAWLGASGEEHDFSFPTVDLEVKTTTSETRSHWISSLTQLVPKLNRDLHLASILVTASNADVARSLGDVAGEVLTLAPGRGATILERLQAVGYRHEDRDLYPTRWELRSEIREFLVDETFPRITPAQLDAVGMSPAEIPEVSYRVKLDGRVPVTNPIVPADNVGA